MSKAKERLINSGLLVASVVLSLWAADAALKWLELPKDSNAIMLLSGSSLFTDDEGVRRYEPSKSVQQAALINSKLAYRYDYRTNNLGFVSEYDFLPGSTLDLMIVGDSITEGQEVGPWIDGFQRFLWERHHKSSQNMAIAGNGFVEFERAASFAKSKLQARKAMIVFIPDDMFRQGDKMLANEQCSTYQSYLSGNVVNCESGRPTWHRYDRAFTTAELEDHARSKQRYGLVRTLRRPVIEWGTSAVRWLCRKGMRIPYDITLARRINSECDANPPELPKPMVTQQPAPNVPEYTAKGPSRDQGTTIPAYTVTALKRILTDYGADNVMLVAVPGGSNTVRATRPDLFFAHVLAGEFKSMFHFVDLSESCVLTPEMWGTGGGGHPNVEGYRKLQSCFLANTAIVNFAIR
jgi:hypothetical protein